MSFRDFFLKATKNEAFRYQIELGEAPLRSRIIRVPTGGGKTEAAVLPWLWKSETDPENTPKRLVIFSPMRTLVSQTVGRIKDCLTNLGLSDKVALVELLGKHPELKKRNRLWTEEPERPTILVGTVDLLLSAALNRGYAMSRFRWPVAFGLLHNSALWVVDEIQLMGSAMATFAQLEQFRTEFGTLSPVHTWWMSATVEPAWLATVDFVPPSTVTPANMLALIEDLGIKYTAKKPLRQAKLLNAETVRDAHQGRLTLAVVNTVRAARELYWSLETPVAVAKNKKKQKTTEGSAELFIIHSRFRPVDRKRKMDQLIEADKALRPNSVTGDKYPLGVIVVATQVAEAGLDISAQTMITELAPWASMVQRFGRLNRTGEEKSAQAIWVDVKEPAPYNTEDIQSARERIKLREDVGPASLADIELPAREKQTFVIRQHDFLGLYSTDKDLAGGFTDISEYIRDSDERDVYIGWRELKGNPNGILQQEELEINELCSVPIEEAKIFRSKGHLLWEWNDESGQWEPRLSQDLVPGMTLLCAVSSGGYSFDLGWTGLEQDKPRETEPEMSENDSNKSDNLSLSDWRELELHLADVETAVIAICRSLKIEESLAKTLALAARWHDIGKSLPAWQNAAKRAVEKSGGVYREGIWAKFPAKKGTFRPKLRHEEASTLYAAELFRQGLEGWSELAVYLIACHHGKVRTTLGAYGVKSLRQVKERTLYLPGFIEKPTEVKLGLLDFSGSGAYNASTGRMSVSGPSWAALVSSLVGAEDSDAGQKGALGPFRLAFFEALIVAADGRASRDHKGNGNA